MSFKYYGFVQSYLPITLTYTPDHLNQCLSAKAWQQAVDLNQVCRSRGDIWNLLGLDVRRGGPPGLFWGTPGLDHSPPLLMLSCGVVQCELGIMPVQHRAALTLNKCDTSNWRWWKSQQCFIWCVLHLAMMNTSWENQFLHNPEADCHCSVPLCETLVRKV